MSASDPVLTHPDEDEELPGYTPTRELHKNVKSLLNRNDRPWLSLTLLSEALRGSKYPVYFNGGTVRGSAQIILENAQTIRSVVIEVQGKLALATADELAPIWHERKILWEPSPASQPETISSPGTWEWPFAFPIPARFDDSVNGGSASAPLPGSFDLKPYPAFVEYRVLLFVKRGKWFPALSELHTLFAYVVRERAPGPSPLRVLAYSQGYVPPDPSGDPDGWECGKTVTAKGILFGNREVTLAYQSYINKPAVYSRGGTIFYRIEISSSDSQALQLLSTPAAIAALLTREVRSIPLRKSSKASSGTKGADLDVQIMAQGISWVNSSSLDVIAGARTLEGEIVIPPEIHPSVDMAAFQLHYSVAFVINAVGFAPYDRAQLIHKQSVRLVSHPSLSPAPVSRIPPGYEHTTNRSSSNDLDWALLAIANGITVRDV